MSKRQLIDEIRVMNRTALPEFLARFDEVDLNDYLGHLQRTRKPRLTGDSARYARYFQSATAQAATVQEQPTTAAASLAVMEEVPAASPVQTTPGLTTLESAVDAVEAAVLAKGPQWREQSRTVASEQAKTDDSLANADDEDTRWQDEEVDTVSYSTTYVNQGDEDDHESDAPTAQADDINQAVTEGDALVASAAQAQPHDAAASDSWLFT